MAKVLITGGAGFIGSHTTDFLIDKGFDVNVIDNLSLYTHPNGVKPEYLNKKAKYFFGDCRDSKVMNKALDGVNYVIHDCSLVGTGHSISNFDEYIQNNIASTSSLWDHIIKKKIKIKKFIQASSVSIYGEGSYKCEEHGIFYPEYRKIFSKKKLWGIKCNKCQKLAKPISTKENSPLNSRSIYSLTKQHQEEISKMIGEIYEIDVITCRYFNCYGSRLSLSNPYTGVTSNFINNIVNNISPMVYEDGGQLRDYIHVKDLVRAKYTILIKKRLKNKIFNIGSGLPTSLLDLIKEINKINDSDISPIITNEYRVGDIRSSFANINQLKNIGFKNFVSLKEGLKEMIFYAKEKSPKKQKKIYFEMKRKGLIIS